MLQKNHYGLCWNALKGYSREKSGKIGLLGPFEICVFLRSQLITHRPERLFYFFFRPAGGSIPS